MNYILTQSRSKEGTFKSNARNTEWVKKNMPKIRSCKTKMKGKF